MSGQQAVQLSEFEQGIIRDHSGASTDASNFTVYWHLESQVYDCFAYALNVLDRFVTPSDMRALTRDCKPRVLFLTSQPLTKHSTSRS